jgi:hypothetical protein
MFIAVYLDGSLELLVFFLELFSISERARNAESGTQHPLCTVDPSNDLNKKKRLKHGFITNVLPLLDKRDGLSQTQINRFNYLSWSNCKVTGRMGSAQGKL